MREGGATRECRSAALFGVLGGMGPLATAEFYRHLVLATPATSDQGHIPVLLRSVPQVNERSAAILGIGPSPLNALTEGVRALNDAGVQEIAIACNTAHHWYDAMCKASAVPVLHIADAAVEELCKGSPTGSTVGILGTSGTIHSGFYSRRLQGHGWSYLVPPPADQSELVDLGIRFVKQGLFDEGRRCLAASAEWLISEGAQVLLLACTEVGLVVDRTSVPMIDANRALAQYCAKRWFNAQGYVLHADKDRQNLETMQLEKAHDFHS